ncbi:hypothetical protein Nekkels1_72 [Cellulophaga phage Nekkels_1]|uniref:Uncharacterized protein n=1 Tax=Cellulophaga phage Nekkels_1 TaxID=2745692 RepID=A0A8E4XXV2_9CAUD|nr:hypothetical protein M1M31_gp72 [Cellulophaga phage Nekkels_1]QQO97077.1 hypothetical protein Nekkels1_72 [Cellulophaga phage Nekkels_1]QQO97172.1 hypothetical protein Nekkels2_74 [Cellulophaga phage Nekkels_2]
MKITFEQVLSRQEWIHRELLSSLDGDTISEAQEKGVYEVKLLINGKELEPKFFNDLMNRLELYIKEEAREMIEEKLFKVEQKGIRLEEIVKLATEKIRDEFNIDSEN